ncbi:hypothetical protein [Corynebacterium accolens]|uniref:hypothetical protein n=1 Tax=Corynebacterium accolens TaxID=38284 RepID=UPI003080B705
MSSDGIVLHVVGYMAFYFVLVLPIFLVRRYLWEKRQKQGSEPDEKGKDEQP